MTAKQKEYNFSTNVLKFNSLLRGSMEPKYSFGCTTSKPNGCLLNTEGSRMIFFEECKNSARPNFKIDTHLFYTNHLGEPGGYKSSEKLNIDIAWEKWHELHKKGWTEVAHNYG